MEIIIDQENRVVKPVGRIDTNSCNDLDAVLMTFPDQTLDILIDMSACPYLSSAGIRILLNAKKRMSPASGVLYMAGVSPAVLQVLEMAGLHKVFSIGQDMESILGIMKSRKKMVPGSHLFEVDGHRFIYSPSGDQPVCHFWRSPGIVSYEEMEVGLGFGTPGEQWQEASDGTAWFVSTGNCTGYYIVDDPHDTDFRITEDPAGAGFPVLEGLSFGQWPSGLLTMPDSEKCAFGVLYDAIAQLKAGMFAPDTLILAIAADYHHDAPTITIGVFNDDHLQMRLKNLALPLLSKAMAEDRSGIGFKGLRFCLGEPEPLNSHFAIEALGRLLTFENILAVEPVDMSVVLERPQVLLFVSEQTEDGEDQRIVIETTADYILESQYAFLIRKLYRDASRLIVEQLHGGYSAQTFHVTSFDPQGRKMGPTVLKISGRALIARESEGCQRYALPYIFNNSAVVQGTEFYGDKGALRYNFVGIGGEESTLKWLTHYYHQEDIPVLEPIFDKIFLKILKPWYGQPIAKAIFPFRDHDPTCTFFPFIYQTVQELFSISAEEQYLQIPEFEHPILNPYWFLKHEYVRYRDKHIGYFTGICHGDLNMQNILLDEKMNVYLIDFSETKPRSVVSDFARLEAIFMVDNAPVDTEADFIAYIQFIREFYNTQKLNDIPDTHYGGMHHHKVSKNTHLTLKMRRYAFDCVHENPDPTPYYLALLEWVLPIVCYGSAPLHQKRLSVILSSMLCEKVDLVLSKDCS